MRNSYQYSMAVVRIVLSCFMMIWVPVYSWYNGWQNFLWFSDLGLFLTLIAVWFELSLPVSMAVIGILPFEIVWNIDFFLGLFKIYTFAFTAYMFDPQKLLLVRALSLFHVFLPVLWIWLLLRWGYDRRALLSAIIFMWTVLFLTYFFTDPVKNINWVFMPVAHQWDMPLSWWLAIMCAVVVAACWIMDRIVQKILVEK